MHTPIAMAFAHYIICSFGMFTNATLFIIALTKTPKEMKTYGSVLATSAVVDFSVALSSGLTFAKVEMLEIYALTGLSNYFGSFLLSIHLFAVALAGHAYFAYNITFCFCYRTSCPCHGVTFTFYVMISVFRDTKAFRAYLSCHLVITPFPFAYGLIIQSCLPIIDLIGLAFFCVSQYTEIKSEAAGHSLLKCFEIVVSLHPLTSLYFVRPYRIAILRFVGASSALHKASLSVTSKKGSSTASSTVVSPQLLTCLYFVRPCRISIAEPFLVHFSFANTEIEPVKQEQEESHIINIFFIVG
ncbi:hypothetical protein PRIPAC_88280 [Pristionchus pacificus]|uniref:G protein-coupled receptor n=1 Tax=Pristionchus pacificus TaxID=54126 RepID=A0A2A6CY65_PRIPA|nr:hypothetical protein PRIPAC_88280 [Pristionchus pacificus]|eukprot:PDM83078.1 G protein-coupled receptor [Pristionchus pacificus]